MLIELMNSKNMTKYRLSKMTDIPYSTISDLCSGKTKIEKSSAETVYRLAKALEVSMEDLIKPDLIFRSDFENFKSTVCHQLKEMGDKEFLVETLESNDIRTYYERRWYPECLYLLAMLDYVSRENNIPLCKDYDDIRKCSLQETLYPASVRAISVVSDDDKVLEKAKETAIPEFLRFNIVENEVRNVI